MFRLNIYIEVFKTVKKVVALTELSATWALHPFSHLAVCREGFLFLPCNN